MNKQATRIGVMGAGGRMGATIIAELAGEAWPGLVLAGAIERAGHPLIGTPLRPDSALTLGSNPRPLAQASDVLIDFTTPAALEGTLDACCDGRSALVVGTTGLTQQHHALIDRAAAHIAVLQASNTSLGVALLCRLVAQAAQALGPDWDIEISELHHRQKADAPSGTALTLGAAAARGRGINLEEHSERGRDGVSARRSAGNIGFSSLRGGTAAGDHMVLLAGEGERIELWHRAENRAIFARGALKAAAWLAGRKPGRYDIDAVLGLPER